MMPERDQLPLFEAARQEQEDNIVALYQAGFNAWSYLLRRGVEQDDKVAAELARNLAQALDALPQFKRW